MAFKMATSSQSASPFVSVLDTDSRPLIFHIRDDEKFCALKANAIGPHTPIDLSSKLGISDKVQAFAVSQNQTSGKLYIAFATGATKFSQSAIYIMDGILPAFVDAKDEDFRQMLLSTDAPPSNICITDFHINPSVEDKWPLLVGVWRNVQSMENIQIARIRTQEKRWEWITNLGIHQTVKDIRSICTLRTPLGEAIACLYQYGNTKSIYIITANEEQRHFHSVVEVPEGSDPRGLAAVLDGENNSTLLISGSGLSRLTSDQIFSGGSRATTISSDPLYQTASHLVVTQTGQDFALWFRTDDHKLGYQQGQGGQLVGPPVHTRPDHPTVDFSLLFDPKSNSQSLVILGEKNNLDVITRSDVTAAWEAQPLTIQQHN